MQLKHTPRKTTQSSCRAKKKKAAASVFLFVNDQFSTKSSKRDESHHSDSNYEVNIDDELQAPENPCSFTNFFIALLLLQRFCANYIHSDRLVLLFVGVNSFTAAHKDCKINKNGEYGRVEYLSLENRVY